MRHAIAPDDTTRRLIAMLLDGLAIAPRTQRIPRALLADLMREMLGRDRGDPFGVPSGDARSFARLRRVLASYGRIASRPIAARLSRRLGRRFLDDLTSDALVQLR